MGELWIGRDKSPKTVFNICCYKLKNVEKLVLVALEGAIVIAVDAVNMLVRENIVVIDQIQTSLVEVRKLRY